MKHDFKRIEPKWQMKWEEDQIFRAEDYSTKPKFYGLIEFPYPSGAACRSLRPAVPAGLVLEGEI